MMQINLAAAVIVLVRGLLTLNQMCPGTDIVVRATWLLLTVAAAAVLLLGAPPTWPEVTLHCGIAALVCVHGRSPTICEGMP